MDIFPLITVTIAAVLWALAASADGIAVGPWCLSCPNIRHAWMCNEAVRCLSSEICLTERFRSNKIGGGVQSPRYRTGCQVRDVCERLHYLNQAPSPVGKRQSEVDILCGECCDTDFCNAKGLCMDTAQNPAGGPMCFACHNVQSIEQCKLVIPCAAGEQCSARKKLWEGKEAFDFECVPQANCSADCMACCKGDYCQATLDTSHIQCNPNPKAARITTPLPHVREAEVGDTVVLPCRAKGDPPLQHTWSRDGVPMTLTSQCITACLLNGSDLQLTRVDRVDSGIYRCDVSNRQGRDNTSVILRVHGEPNISVYPKFVSPRVGDVVSILCNITGVTANHHVDFVFDSARRPSNVKVTRSTLQDATLTFTYSGPGDSGQYVCKDLTHPLGNSETAVVAENLGVMSCSSPFSKCPAQEGMVCSVSCPGGCGYKNHGAWYQIDASVCGSSSHDVDNGGGCVAWLMAKDSSGQFQAKVVIGRSLYFRQC